ncbi:MAG: hypothetical protein ACP5I3_12050, partial [Thermoproteus sp.]
MSSEEKKHRRVRCLAVLKDGAITCLPPPQDEGNRPVWWAGAPPSALDRPWAKRRVRAEIRQCVQSIACLTEMLVNGVIL